MRSYPGKELHDRAHLHRRLLPLIVGGWLALGSASCTPPTEDAPNDAAPSAVDGAPSFEDSGAIYDLDASTGEKVRLTFGGCAGNEGCHVSGAGGLSFPQGDEFRNVVSVPSSERPELMRVRPGSKEESYLYLKVLGDGGIDGSMMPPGSGGGGDARLVDLIGEWIEAGAPRP